MNVCGDRKFREECGKQLTKVLSQNFNFKVVILVIKVLCIIILNMGCNKHMFFWINHTLQCVSHVRNQAERGES